MYNLYEMLVEYCSYVQHSIEDADVTYTLVGKLHTVDIGSIVTRPDGSYRQEPKYFPISSLRCQVR